MTDDKSTELHYRQIIKYTGLFGGIQTMNILVGLVRNKLTALLLGPLGMGLVALYQSSVKLVSDSTGLGLGMSGVREISDAYSAGDDGEVERLVKVIRSWSVVAALVGTLLCALLCKVFDSLAYSWGSHTLHFLLLSPMVGMMAITSGETAVLKATRRMKALAISSFYSVLSALVVSVPLYWFYGSRAVVPSLVLVCLAQMLAVLVPSYRAYPLRLSFKRDVLRQGVGTVRVGMAFVLAGFMCSGAEYAVRSYLNYVGSEAVLGLYNAAYMLVVTYAGMVFSAMETDYFPRLSAACLTNGRNMNDVVNRQAEVSVLLISPLTVCFVFMAPVMLPLLFSGKFMPVLPMIQVAAVSMFFRGLYLPVEYISLAKGHSRSFCFLEGINSLMMLAFVVVGYNIHSLWGAGVGLTLAAAVEVCVSFSYMRFKYNYRCSSSLVKNIALQLPLVLASLVLPFVDGSLYRSLGLFLIISSSAMSLNVLDRKTSFIDDIKRKLKKMNKRRRGDE